MKREMNLIRDILMELEKRSFDEEYTELIIEGYSTEDIMYHVKLLHEAHLIHADDMSSASDMYYLPGSLTWDGHEFLELAKSDSRWNKAKDIMTNRVGGFVFDVLKQLLITLVKESILQG